MQAVEDAFVSSGTVSRNLRAVEEGNSKRFDNLDRNLKLTNDNILNIQNQNAFNSGKVAADVGCAIRKIETMDSDVVSIHRTVTKSMPRMESQLDAVGNGLFEINRGMTSGHSHLDSNISAVSNEVSEVKRGMISGLRRIDNHIRAVDTEVTEVKEGMIRGLRHVDNNLIDLRGRMKIAQSGINQLMEGQASLVILLNQGLNFSIMPSNVDS